jgi:hypothetical protein
MLKVDSQDKRTDCNPSDRDHQCPPNRVNKRPLLVEGRL